MTTASHRQLDGTTPTTTSITARVIDLSRNVALLTVLYFAYSVVRQITAGDVTVAFSNARNLVDFQQAIGLPSETILQSPLLQHPEIITAANTFYMWVHFPATAAFLFWSWYRHPHHFRIIRGSLVTLTSAGLLLHLLFPLAPPRLRPSAGYLDTGAVFGPSPYDLAVAEAANQIAAMPSLHVGWALLVAISVIALSRSRWRFLIIAHPIITTLVVVVTANHYWTDAIIAALLVASSWVLMARLHQVPVLNLNDGQQPPPPGSNDRLDLDALEQSAQVGVEDLAQFPCSSPVGVNR